MSKRSEAKRARRTKRRVSRDATWIPGVAVEEVMDDLDLADALEKFDLLISERGWAFDDDQSDEEFAIWFYPPSGTAVGDGLEPVTTIWMHADDDDARVHVILVGTGEDRPLPAGAFFDHLDAIEGYRLGDALPQFG